MLYGFLYGMASANARRSSLERLLCSKIKLEISSRQLCECIQQTLPLYYLTSKLWQRTPSIAASNGVFTKRNTAQFRLLLFKN